MGYKLLLSRDNNLQLKDRIIIKQKTNNNYMIGNIDVIANTRNTIYVIIVNYLYNKETNKFTKLDNSIRKVCYKEDIHKIYIRKV